MKHLKTTLAALAVTFIFGAVGCAFLDKQADERLGVDCSEEARIFRAAAFTDMLGRQYGDSAVDKLRDAVQLMQDAADAGADLDSAGDVYKFRFVELVVEQLKVRGLDVVSGNYRRALDRLKEIPNIAAEINTIETRVGILCAQQLAQ